MKFLFPLAFKFIYQAKIVVKVFIMAPRALVGDEVLALIKPQVGRIVDKLYIICGKYLTDKDHFLAYLNEEFINRARYHGTCRKCDNTFFKLLLGCLIYRVYGLIYIV